jgi:geranylgeranyl pyrophosphate synthase
MERALAAWAEPRIARVEALLASRFAETTPPKLGEALLYPLRSGGKRVRPLLALAAGEAVAADEPPALLPIAAAFELVHTYSLVHDDLPCMDDDDLRRGVPTVHKAFGEGPAVLVGDALLTEAFLLAAESGSPALVRELALAAGHQGMIGGQADDIGMGGAALDLDRLLSLHRRKTGALIRGAVRAGAIAAGASEDALAALTAYGEAVGLAFQLADDALDAESDAGTDGPPSFVRLIGRDATLARARALADDAILRVRPFERKAPLEALARFTVERLH